MDIVSDSVMTNEPAEQYMHNVCKLNISSNHKLCIKINDFNVKENTTKNRTHKLMLRATPTNCFSAVFRSPYNRLKIVLLIIICCPRNMLSLSPFQKRSFTT